MTSGDRPTQSPADVVPGYELVDVLGEGGMGRVYRAEQHEPVERIVALKVIKLGMDSEEVLRRFEFERSVLAQLNHDAVAKVYGAGVTERGQPYFAMEYVPDALPLNRYCDERELSLPRRIELFLRVCAGVEHAHQNGVIHRDLKPANVLVGEQSGEPIVKIIDFGLARATDQQRVDATMMTQSGQLVGTPAYMSPEQAGSGNEIDTRTDVYALGVILYELLTGELPFSTAELLSGGLLEMQRKIRQDEPPLPSRRLEGLGRDARDAAGVRGATPRALVAALRRDLDWVVGTAIAKEPQRRYQSVGELGAELRRYLADEPVIARAPSFGYRARKFIRRYRVQTAAAGVALLALVGALVVSLVSRAETRFERDRQDRYVVLGLREDAQDLWPVSGEVLPAIDSWLASARALRSRVDRQRAYLEELRSRGRLGRDGELVFEDSGDADELRKQELLLERLGDFLDAEPRSDNLAGVEERRRWILDRPAVTLERHADRWREAVAAIRSSDGSLAHTAYGGLELEPQVGLIPIGMDPESRLWEFYHPGSAEDPYAEVPERAAEGHMPMREELGLVFVLVPGGSFRMGCEGGAELERLLQPEPDEQPAHRVELAPFFLSKYETTQAQWARLYDGDDPSFYRPGYAMPDGCPPLTRLNPVEQVDPADADEVARRWGLALPTEAQWEYAARAGTRSLFWWGDEVAGGEGRENVADVGVEEDYGVNATQWSDLLPWRDAHIVHAPVGSFSPNPFGLYDVAGNVSEVCADLEGPYENPVRAGDGLRTPLAGEVLRIRRGGAWFVGRHEMRVADREEVHKGAGNVTGLRLARAVEGTAGR